MWVRKSQQEIKQKESHRKFQCFQPQAPLLLSVCLVAVLWFFTREKLDFMLFTFSLIFATLYVVQIIFGSVSRGFEFLVLWNIPTFSEETLICNKCFKAKVRDKKFDCECGGTYESINNWRWQE